MDENEEEEQARVPVVDLRGLDKDELLRASQVSCEPVIELVTPSIDKKMFNESASSGKQTFCSFYSLPESSHRITSSSGQQVTKAKGHEGSKANGLNSEGPKASKSISQSSYELEPNGIDRAKKRSKVVDLGQEAAMTKYLLEMEGTWVSPRKQDKIIAAKGFPKGWKVTASLRRKEGRCYLEFRNYVSPDGKSWPSFKEGSGYLISDLAQAPLVRKLRLLGLVDNLESESVESGKNTDLGEEQVSEVAEPCPGVVDLESATENQNTDSAGNSGDEQKQQSSTPNSNGLEKQNKNDETMGAEQKQESPSPTWEEQNKTEEKVKVADSFQCETCNKVFSIKKQYWGHLSKHSKLRKSASKKKATDHTSNNQNNTLELVKNLSQPLGSTPSLSKNAVDVSMNVDAIDSSALLQDNSVECRSGSLKIGWCDEGCYTCKKAVPLSQLILCSWCEKEFHVSCVGIAGIPPGDWTCPACKFPK